MNTYLRGAYILGAGAIGFGSGLSPSTPSTAPSVNVVESVPATVLWKSTADNDFERQQQQVRDAKKRSIVTNGVLLFLAGLGIGGAGGALIWKAHRGLGFLLGFILGGPVIGGAAVTLYAARIKPNTGAK